MTEEMTVRYIGYWRFPIPPNCAISSFTVLWRAQNNNITAYQNQKTGNEHDLYKVHTLMKQVVVKLTFISAKIGGGCEVSLKKELAIKMNVPESRLMWDERL